MTTTSTSSSSASSARRCQRRRRHRRFDLPTRRRHDTTRVRGGGGQCCRHRRWRRPRGEIEIENQVDPSCWRRRRHCRHSTYSLVKVGLRLTAHDALLPVVAAVELRELTADIGADFGFVEGVGGGGVSSSSSGVERKTVTSVTVS